MSFQGSAIAPGTPATTNVAVDRISSIDYQRTKLSDGTEGSTSAIGIDANPLRVKQRRRGTGDYDSGIVTVTTTLSVVTGTTIYVEGGWITNYTGNVRTITITNGSDIEVVSQFALAPRSTVPIPGWTAGMGIVGIKVSADANSAIRMQIWGSL